MGGKIHFDSARVELIKNMDSVDVQAFPGSGKTTILCGKFPKTKTHPEKKLKCQYVAMTRARALICLAIPIDFVDEAAQKQLQNIGWNIRKI